MLLCNTDRDWELLGKLDPYWAVITIDAFRGDPTRDPVMRGHFLDTGRQYVAHMWDQVRCHVDPNFAPRTALDFGCGVGRVALFLAERCEAVTGVDIARSMLIKAEELCESEGVRNVTFVKGDDSLSNVTGTFDLIHSYIVMQHMRPERGVRMFKKLVDRLNPGGVGVIQFLYHNPHVRGFRGVLRNVWGRISAPFRRIPKMQMNAYPLNELFHILQTAGARQMQCEFTDHSGMLGVILYFRKDQTEPDAPARA